MVYNRYNDVKNTMMQKWLLLYPWLIYRKVILFLVLAVFLVYILYGIVLLFVFKNKNHLTFKINEYACVYILPYLCCHWSSLQFNQFIINFKAAVSKLCYDTKGRRSLHITELINIYNFICRPFYILDYKDIFIYSHRHVPLPTLWTMSFSLLLFLF